MGMAESGTSTEPTSKYPDSNVVTLECIRLPCGHLIETPLRRSVKMECPNEHCDRKWHLSLRGTHTWCAREEQ